MVVVELDIGTIPATFPPITHVFMREEFNWGLNISANIPFWIMKQVLMAMVELYVGIIPSTLPPIIHMEI